MTASSLDRAFLIGKTGKLVCSLKTPLLSRYRKEKMISVYFILINPPKGDRSGGGGVGIGAAVCVKDKEWD